MLNNTILCSLAILFIYSAFQPGNIFEKAGIWLEVKLGVSYNPVIGCLYCMAPWWGVVYYFAMPYIPEWVQFVLAVGGINVLIAGFISYVRNRE